MYGPRMRNQRGGAVIGLMIALFFFLLVAGLFSFDASRLQMLQRELSSLAEAGSLAGTSMMCSYDTSGDAAPAYSKLTSAQNNGMNYAYNMVAVGNILGSNLTSGTCTLSLSYTSFQQPSLGHCNVFIQIINPTTGAPITVPDPTGRAMQVQLCYGYRPVFWPIFNGTGVMPIKVISLGGLPQVDTVMVFDFSGSMDDLTVVTIVYRLWDNTTNKMNYQVISPCSTYTSVTGEPSTCLANYVGWNYTNAPTGMVANVLPPQNLDSLGAVPANYQANCNNPLVFDYYTRRFPDANDYGTPPGNCHLTYASYSSIPDINAGVHFTDIVVNIANPGTPPLTQPLTGTSPFTGFTIDFNKWGTYTIADPTTGSTSTFNYETDNGLQGNTTYNFENLGVLVEAARGNMDSKANLLGAFPNLVSYTAPPNDQGYAFPATATNYQKAYQQLALLYAQPIATALDGAYTGFYQKLEGLADCRFGFVGFSDNTAFGNTAPFNTNAHLKSAYDSSYNLPGGGTVPLYPRSYSVAPDKEPYMYAGTAENGPTDSVWVPRSELDATATQLTSFTNAANPDWPDTGKGNGSNGLYGGVATGGTDCGEALETAVAEFNIKNKYAYNASFTASGSTIDRRAARRAVIFFTDGIPTDQTAGTAPSGNSLSAAQTAKTEGITFYTIGLALNPGLSTPQQKFLDTNTGLCAIALNSSAYFAVNSTTEIKSAFAGVVRRLTQDQRQQ